VSRRHDRDARLMHNYSAGTRQSSEVGEATERLCDDGALRVIGRAIAETDARALCCAIHLPRFVFW